MNEELISVIIPVYNVRKYLKYCLDSVLKQTYSNLEIILVDDGSTDGSGEMCDEYADVDKRIVVIHQENGGLSAARNTGLQYCKAKLVGFVDSDDCISTDMYEDLYACLRKTESDIACCRFQYINGTTSSVVDNNGDLIGIFTGKEALFNLYSQDERINAGMMWNKLFKKKLFDQLGFAVGKWHEDDRIIHRLFDRAKRVSYLTSHLYGYRQRQTSFMSRYNVHRLDALEAYQDRIDYYTQQGYEDLLALTYEYYLHLLQYHYYCLLKHFPFKIQLRRNLVKEVERVLSIAEIETTLKEDYHRFTKHPIIYKIIMKVSKD